jgi:hypothetical protein
MLRRKLFVKQRCSLKLEVTSYVFSLPGTSLGNFTGNVLLFFCSSVLLFAHLPLRFFSAVQVPWLHIIPHRKALNLGTEPIISAVQAGYKVVRCREGARSVTLGSAVITACLVFLFAVCHAVSCSCSITRYCSA